MLSKRRSGFNSQNISIKDEMYCYILDTVDFKLKVEKITNFIYKNGLYEKDHKTICSRYGLKKLSTLNGGGLKCKMYVFEDTEANRKLFVKEILKYQKREVEIAESILTKEKNTLKKIQSAIGGIKK